MFFFCQAEDGIRDGHVTGVQTCALPIFTQIPWYYLAAIDQFERNIETDLSEDQVISIQIPDDQWFGPGNSSKLMHNEMIALFEDRKSTRLNSSHVAISYAVFCLKKKK